MFMPQSYDHTITGRIIRQLRQERGMSQEVLSGLAAVSRSHLAEIENGRDKANVDTLWRIAGALEIRLSDLIRRVEDEIERRI
jgi:transcriptional regulator with XRE-family HTH domain